MNQRPDLDPRIHQAADRLKQGRAQEALELVNTAIQQGHASPVAWDIYAQACVNVGQVQPAILGLKKAIAVGGGRLDRVLLLGEMLVRAQQWQEAADIYQQVLKQDSDQAKAWYGLGESLLGTMDVERAIRCFSGALDRQPGYPEARQRLGVCFLEKGEVLKAELLLKKLVDEYPDAAGPKLAYAEALRQASRHRMAQEILAPLVDHSVVGQSAKRRLIDVCLQTEELDRAESLLEDVMDDAGSNDPDWIMKRARLDNIYGRNDKARELLESMLENEPGMANGWKQLLDISRQPLTVWQLEAVKEQTRLARKLGRMAVASDFYFAQARHYELAKDVDAEFEALKKANSLKNELVVFDHDKYLERFLPSRASYDSQSLSAWRVPNPEGPAPIFILSLPRSGSTLVEQVLGAHSETEATGEADFAEQAWYALTGERSVFASPQAHAELSRGKVEKFRRYYLEAAEEAGFDIRKHLVNKGINNHKFAGLLKVAFPEGRFIDLRRDMMDVAFGCYRQNFAGQFFSFSLEGCAREVALFYDNMAYWRSQLSDDAFFRLDYEVLVEDFENQVRDLLAFCGLEWQPQCLEFQKAPGKVSTASINQVSQGLFKQGVARWRKYEKHLGPLVEALRNQGLDPLAD